MNNATLHNDVGENIVTNYTLLVTGFLIFRQFISNIVFKIGIKINWIVKFWHTLFKNMLLNITFFVPSMVIIFKQISDQ